MKKQDLKNKCFTNPLTFSNEEDILLCFESDLWKKHSWAGKFGIEFNGKMEFFKTFTGFNKRIENLVDKYKLIKT